MAQPAFGAVRQAVADYLTATIGLRCTANRFGQINPPVGVVMPQTGTIIRYSTTFDGETDYSLRLVVLVSEGDSTDGQAALDAYLSPAGGSSVYAAIQADPSLGGKVSFAAVIEATGYGLTTWGAIQYLGCSLVLNIGT